MIENNVYELKAIELDYQGKGICKIDNMVVFVPKNVTWRSRRCFN